MSQMTPEIEGLIEAREQCLRANLAQMNAERIYKDAVRAFCKRHALSHEEDDPDRGTHHLLPDGLLIVVDSDWDERKFIEQAVSFHRPRRIGS